MPYVDVGVIVYELGLVAVGLAVIVRAVRRDRRGRRAEDGER